MNARLLIEGRGNIPSYEYILAGSKVSNSYSGEVIIELSSTTSQVNLLSEIESQSGKQIEDIKTDIRVIIPLGVTINPYQHSGATGIDAIDMTGIPSDKSIIIENYGTIIGSGGLGSEGTYSGSNQTRNGQVGNGGSCFKLVNLEKLVLINEGNLYGGKGVGANGSGGRGGNGALSNGQQASFNCSPTRDSWSPYSMSTGSGGIGGEWDGYGYSSWTRGTSDGGYTHKQHWELYQTINGVVYEAADYKFTANIPSTAGAGGKTSYGGLNAVGWYSTVEGIFYAISSGTPSNGGAGGSSGGKGGSSSGYGQGKAGASGGSAGGSGGGACIATDVRTGNDRMFNYLNGVDGGGSSGSTGSSGGKGNGGGILTSATIADFSYVDNGTMLSGKNLDGNAGGYLL